MAVMARAGVFEDLRDWMNEVERIGEMVVIRGADPHLEIGSITEYAYRATAGGPAILFEDVRGFPGGYRILTNPLSTMRRLSLTLNVDAPQNEMDFVQFWRKHSKSFEMRPVEQVSDGPLFQNVQEGADVDLLQFPTPLWHQEDGGPYLGTGSLTITRDADSGWVNVGTYRAMVHDHNTLGLYVSRIKHGRRHMESWWARKEPCPVVLTFGQDPLLFLVSSIGFPAEVNELEYAGAIRERPVQVIHGELTGLPIPAAAEIAIEGEIYPDDTRDEGPFGEWTGYYASDTRPEPVIRVKRLMYRDQPIILGVPPFRPPNTNTLSRTLIKAGLIWDNLDAAGVPDVRGVWADEAGGGNLMVVVSIKQRYPGHARQAGLIASQCAAAITLARYVIVVDEDIDPSNRDDVLWAICTRSDPERSIEILHRCFSSALDPITTGPGPYHHSRAVIDACKPFERLNSFPHVVSLDRAEYEDIRQKWGSYFEGWTKP
ncbi:MAG TPA: UbiD family decarboxylase [Chloroflexota bacterium]|nr:UbiD family decarboxylase [Chloroflexota bacterium]